MKTKEELRKEFIQLRNQMDAFSRSTGSYDIIKCLMKRMEYKTANEVFTYVSFGSEVDTYVLISACFSSGKRVFTPKIIKKGVMEFYEIHSFEELHKGSFGIYEPEVSLQGFLDGHCKQLMIVPGVTFDCSCNRLGYGGGYYDRYLSKVAKAGVVTKIALAFEKQMVSQVPVEGYDCKVDYVITEKRVYGNRREG